MQLLLFISLSLLLVALLAAHKQMEVGLTNSNDRLQFVLDTAKLGWWEFDPATRTIRWDKCARDLFNIPKITTSQEFYQRIHPDDRERVSTAITAALNPDDPRSYWIEYRIHPHNHDIRWVETRGLARFPEAGGERQQAAYIVGTAQDITKRKQLEQEHAAHDEKERLLMREVSHRAKNILSVVDAIAHQTAATNPDDFIAHFSERLQALAANQDLLFRNQWQGIEVDQLIRTQLLHFADLIGSRITVDGPKLRLNPTSAQAVGLALHELATNAGKYGALSTNTGCVEVCWRANDDAFEISWTERKGPQVSAPQRRGFGTVVMKEMAERSLDGKVSLDYSPSGVMWRLHCPAANALDSAGAWWHTYDADRAHPTLH